MRLGLGLGLRLTLTDGRNMLMRVSYGLGERQNKPSLPNPNAYTHLKALLISRRCFFHSAPSLVTRPVPRMDKNGLYEKPTSAKHHTRRRAPRSLFSHCLLEYLVR